MKSYRLSLISILFFGLTLIPQRTYSQFDQSCPAVIQRALRQVEQICAGTNRNQVCYANAWTRAEPQATVTDFSFELGDITDLANIRRLQLGGLNADLNQWGMVLMRLQANVPVSIPGQNVLFLFFGDVDVEDQYGTPEMLASSPMQAIRLSTGIGGMGCDQAPPSGLLVQTPHGVGRVLLSVNGVDVSLGSTVFFTAQAGADLTVSTIEGSALVHANGQWSAALPGTQVRVPMSQDLTPSGLPGLPEPYAVSQMVTLPISPLDRPVEVPPPLLGLELETLRRSILAGTLPQIGDFSALSLDLTQSSLDFLGDTVSTTLATTGDVLESTLNDVTDVTAQAFETTTQVVTDTSTTVVNNAQELVVSVLPEPVSQPVNAVVDTAQETANTVTDTAVETANSVVTTAADTVTNTVDTVTDQAQETVNTVQDTIQDLLPVPLLGRP